MLVRTRCSPTVGGKHVIYKVEFIREMQQIVYTDISGKPVKLENTSQPTNDSSHTDVLDMFEDCITNRVLTYTEKRRCGRCSATMGSARCGVDR